MTDNNKHKKKESHIIDDGGCENTDNNKQDK